MSRPRGRRVWLAGALSCVVALALLAGLGGAAPRERTAPEGLTVKVYPIASFEIGNPDRRRFGDLEFRGGLELRANHPAFGGISAIRMRPDGESFLAVGDTGDWLTGRIVFDRGRPSGLADVVIAPLIGPGGEPTRITGYYDSEALAEVGEVAYVAIERRNAILRFDRARGGLASVGAPVPVPPALTRLPTNRGIEALGVMPPRSRFAGQLIAISERSRDTGDTTAGFLIGGREPSSFEVRRRDGFDVTDLDFLPSGDLVLLERFFSPLRGVAMRLRRIALADVRPGAVLDGEVLLQADLGFQIDNMEGLSIARTPSGETIFTLVSDDNFSFVQRTLLLQFLWLGN